MALDAGDREGARAQLRARRAAMPAAARIDADAAICARLDTLVRALAPATVAGYWAMRDEPELVALLTRWHEAGVAIALPRVVRADAPLEFGRWHPGATMTAGPHGTRHVEPHLALAPELILLPCLGYDRFCHRLGYGGGYYDRTLEALAGTRTVGVAYDDCEVTGFRAQAHDLPLDRIVTERRTLARPAGAA